MIRRLIGWAADFYPNHVFFANGFMPEAVLPAAGDVNAHDTQGTTALLATVVTASRTLAPGGEMKLEYTGVTDCGKDVGDYTIIIKREAK